jgi:hypothetical protein
LVQLLLQEHQLQGLVHRQLELSQDLELLQQPDLEHPKLQDQVCFLLDQERQVLSAHKPCQVPPDLQDLEHQLQPELQVHQELLVLKPLLYSLQQHLPPHQVLYFQEEHQLLRQALYSQQQHQVVRLDPYSLDDLECQDPA